MAKPSRISFIITLLILSSCAASWQEMGETSEVPVAIQNRAKAFMQAYWKAPIIGGVSIYLLGIVRGFVPNWPASCEVYAQNAGADITTTGAIGATP